MTRRPPDHVEIEAFEMMARPSGSNWRHGEVRRRQATIALCRCSSRARHDFDSRATQNCEKRRQLLQVSIQRDLRRCAISLTVDKRRKHRGNELLIGRFRVQKALFGEPRGLVAGALAGQDVVNARDSARVDGRRPTCLRSRVAST